MRAVMGALILGYCCCASGEGLRLTAAERNAWSSGDTARQATLSALVIVDWGQTLHMTTTPGYATTCEKTSPSRCYGEVGAARYFIGPHPSRGQINNYFAANLAIAFGIAYVLPRPWREAFQYVYIGGEALTVNSNRKLVFGMKIPL